MLRRSEQEGSIILKSPAANIASGAQKPTDAARRMTMIYN
jgi:hypothetical protein